MKPVSARRDDKIAYALLLVLATVQLGFNLYWAGVEGLGRLGLWPRAWVWFDLDAFLAGELGLSQLIFATFVGLFFAAYVLILMRRRGAFWLLLAAVIAGRIDWILLAFNDFLNGSWMVLAEIATQLVALLLCWGLRARGFFR